MAAIEQTVSNSAVSRNDDYQVAVDQIGAAQYQRVKIELGNLGGNDGPISSSNPMPVAGTLLATPVSPSGIVAGAKTVATAGTRETLVAISTPCRSVTITAEDNNTGKVYYGGNTVSSLLGDYLFPAQKITIEIDNVQKLFIDADVSTDGVKFSYLT